MQSFARYRLAIAVFLLFSAARPAFALDEMQEVKQRISNGDPVAGKEKSTLCQGCHGETGISTIPTIPNLSGQWTAYTMRQLRFFITGWRSDAIMTEMATTVTNLEDAFDISAYFASQKMMISAPHTNEKGKRLYIIYRCASCHGDAGQGKPQDNPIFPIIGGQHKEYLIKQLDDFRTGARDTDMSGTMPILAKRMSMDETDAIADYLAGVGAASPPPPPAEPEPVPDVWKTLLEDKPIMIEGTNFVTNSAKLKPIAFKQLAAVIEFAKTYPEAILNVIGHTDNTGTEQTNTKLSLARAESVKTYMIKQGITAERITTKGEAANSPIADNKTIAGRAKNRRVEIRTSIKEEKKVLVRPAPESQ